MIKKLIVLIICVIIIALAACVPAGHADQTQELEKATTSGSFRQVDEVKIDDYNRLVAIERGDEMIYIIKRDDSYEISNMAVVKKTLDGQ